MANIPAGWIEVKAPVLFKFEHVGNFIRGTLLSLTNQQMKDQESGQMKAVLLARFELENGGQVELMPSFDLKRKLGRRHVGKELYITYTGDDESTKDKGNAMKVFAVFVNPDSGAETPFIATDDDLPPEMR